MLAQSTYQLPESLAADLARLREMIAQVQAGDLAPERLRAFRVPMGVYEQRENGTFMLRIRVPAGGVLPHQMRAMADAAERYGNGTLHVTTRQDIQVHRVPLANVAPALEGLAQAGLATKGGGGNTVRNITACPHAGVCPHETFNVAPYAVAVTEFLLPDPLSYQLPRKFKLSFSGCGRDCASATVNDVGFIARARGGQRGFAVYVGGGMGNQSRVADLLEEFVPVGEAHLVAEAVKRVFDKHGNRKNRNRARLRFVLEQIGLDGFRALYDAEMAILRREAPACPPPRDFAGAAEGHRGTRPPRPSAAAAKTFAAWRARHVQPQKQDGRFLVEVPFPLGDIRAETMRGLADVVERHGEGLLLTTQEQNGLLRFVAEDELPEVHDELAALGLAEPRPAVLRKLVACAGASTCRLGICLSRGLAQAIEQTLTSDGLDLDGLGPLGIRISGCPNACGRHPVGDIGLYGAARRVDGQLIPHYVVQLGGRVGEGLTRLAEGTTAIPARNVPAFLAQLLGEFERSPEHPDFHAFLDSGGRQAVRTLLARFGRPRREAADACACCSGPQYDWGSCSPFSLAGRGPGECSAGVFDLIEVDLASATQALERGHRHAATVLAARALLVTRGVQPRDDRDALKLFQEHFVAPGLVEAALAPIVENAIQVASDPDPESSFLVRSDVVAVFVQAVKALYENMDNSLRFTPPKPPAPAEAAVAGPAAAEGRTEDYRGVACPLNYVRAKLALEKMQPGEELTLILGDEGLANVPASAIADGHQVVSLTRLPEGNRLVIRKGGGR
ncbi:MAG TPA: sulfurtransferase TusA family protein [Planctomycetota bacterium]|nr:sulfurtransferase TusA family protein [Planctomycetota bacterium]HRR79626.1 sulfurtransferase TusA family protein [Planctomycetota bacterium]